MERYDVGMPTTTAASQARWPSSLVRWLLIASLAAGVLWCAFASAGWKLMVDSPIMHYVLFLMSHGFQPYSQIQDNNLPGSYMAEWVGTHLFGTGDLGWRFFEWLELAISTAAMIVIARPYDWAAGFFGGAVFFLLHTSEGPYFSGERELTLAMLVLVGYAALFQAVRRHHPALMLCMGFCTAYGASIKPTFAPLGPLLLVLTLVVLHRKGERWLAHCLYALAGMLAALALNVGFLAGHGALRSFFKVQSEITTYYASLASSFHAVILGIFAVHVFDLLLLGGLFLIWARRRSASLAGSTAQRWTWEQWALLVGGLVGVLSFVVQRKGFLHHRYVYLEIGLLLIGMELLPALRYRNLAGAIAMVLAAYVALYKVPSAALQTSYFKPNSDLTDSLEADFHVLSSVASLDRQVICLDQVFGCLNALQHNNLVENTGLSGDMLLFGKKPGIAVDHARSLFWQQQQHAPAGLLVLTNEEFENANVYTRTHRWPQYDQIMHQQYRLIAERSFPCEFGRNDQPPDHLYGYRIFARMGTPLASASLPAQPVYTCPLAR